MPKNNSNKGPPPSDPSIKAALDRITDGFVVLDSDLQYTYVNQTAAELLGTPPEDLLEASVFDVFPEVTGTLVEERFEEAMERGDSVTFERYNEEFDVWWEVKAYPDQAGLSVYFRDITERKRSREKQKRFREALDNSNDAIFIVDRHSKAIVDANETACDQLGYDESELIGKSPDDFEVTIDGEAEWEQHFATLRESGTLTYQGRHQRTDGSSYPVEVELSAMEYDMEYVVAIARDISERRERERELLRLEKAVEHAGHAIYITDADGVIEFVNPAFEEITGYPASEAEGQTPEILSSGEQPNGYFDDLWESLTSGEVWHEQIQNRRKSGETYYADQIIAPMTTDGDIEGYIAIHQDITKEKVQERRLDAYRNALETLNGATTDFLTADSGDAIQETLVASVSEIYASEFTALYLYDEANHRLNPATVTKTEYPTHEFEYIEPGNSILWEAFIDSDVRHQQTVTEPWCAEIAPCNCLIVPVGGYGVLVVALQEDDLLGERFLELADLVASIGNAALDRGANEEQIQRQKAQLDQTERRLDELIQITENAVRFQNILWKAESHADVYQKVCDNLAEVNDVGFVWIGEYSPGKQEIIPKEWAGEEGSYVDQISLEFKSNSREPSIRTVLQEDSVAVDNIASDVEKASWRQSALSHGLASVLSVPIAHEDMMYGVISVYFTNPMEYPEQRQMAYEGLGSAIARALSSIDQRQALGAEKRVELEFETTGVDSPLKRLANAIETGFQIESAVRKGEEEYILYGTVSAIPEEEFREGSKAIPNVTDPRVLESTGRELRFEVVVEHDAPPGTVIEVGGKFKDLQVYTDRCILRASFPPTASINRIIDTVSKRHPEWNLKARRTDSQELDTQQFPTAESKLSERQSSILSAALQSGYFEWPRETTGEELAEKLDVSPPTIHRHIRTGMAKLTEHYLEKGK